MEAAMKMFVSQQKQIVGILDDVQQDLAAAGIRSPRIDTRLDITRGMIRGIEQEDAEHEERIRQENLKKYEEFAEPVPPIQEVPGLIKKEPWWKWYFG